MEGIEWRSGLVAGVLPRIRAELRQLLRRYAIPLPSMAEVLARAFVAAEETWEEGGADREDWVLTAVELECSAYRRGAGAERRRSSRWADRRRGRLPLVARAVRRSASTRGRTARKP